MIGIDKSSRHTKIVGHFGEYLVCNWLSRSGFEVSVVDHTGMDVIAYLPHTQQRLGITVKSRTRKPGTETDSVNLFQKAKQDREKLLDACTAFNCEPWIAVYAECDMRADLFLTSLQNYDNRYGTRGENAIDGWRMTEKSVREYEADPEVKHIIIEFKAKDWWNNKAQIVAAT